jgi:TPP-dependent pyruvate/acetoin dehydrogenase alpha subunit
MPRASLHRAGSNLRRGMSEPRAFRFSFQHAQIAWALPGQGRQRQCTDGRVVRKIYWGIARFWRFHARKRYRRGLHGKLPLAVGAALNAMLRRSQDIGVAFFGDGATDEGVFYESLNFAVLRKLPVLFICENNSFSTHMPDFLRQSNPCVHERVAGFGIRSRRVDGNDAMEVYRAAREFVEQARSGEGPGLLECMTFRWLAHVGSDEDVDIGYRRKELIDLWKQRCPINALEGELSRRGVLTGEQLRANRKEASTIVDAAIQFAESGAYPTQDLIGSGL